MNWFLFAATVVSFITFLVHLFPGGDKIAKPLLNASDIQEKVKLTTYYCWHITTILLFVMTCSYAYVGFRLNIPLTVVITTIAGACALLSMGLIVACKLKPLDYPQWILLTPISLFGILGLFSS